MSVTFGLHGLPLLTIKTDRLDLEGLDPGKWIIWIIWIIIISPTLSGTNFICFFLKFFTLPFYLGPQLNSKGLDSLADITFLSSCTVKCICILPRTKHLVVIVNRTLQKSVPNIYAKLIKSRSYTVYLTRLGDMNFIFSCQKQYFTTERSE